MENDTNELERANKAHEEWVRAIVRDEIEKYIKGFLESIEATKTTQQF